MSDNIIQLNEQVIKTELKNLVKQSVEETLNSLLDQEAADLTNASKYERTDRRKGYRSGPLYTESTDYLGQHHIESSQTQRNFLRDRNY